VIWISLKNIEFSQNRKSNLFLDFFLDLGKPASNPIGETDYKPASNLEGQEMHLVNDIETLIS